MTENEAKLILDVRISRFEHADDVNEALNVAKTALKEIQQYRALGTVGELRESMEKQRAKKPLYKYLKPFPSCPTCGEVNLQVNNEYRNVIENHSYCPDCGQKIDWSKDT